MALHTRLTEMHGIEHPIISVPMAFAAGGKLAAAVTTAGGLGLIGGGYGDAEWLEREFAEARNTRVGCGFIPGRSPNALYCLSSYWHIRLLP
jgi:nitronate monooxygenase